MNVKALIEETDLTGDHGKARPGIRATCSRCGHATESFGTGNGSARRCLALLREECPRQEQNHYAEEHASAQAQRGGITVDGIREAMRSIKGIAKTYEEKMAVDTEFLQRVMKNHLMTAQEARELVVGLRKPPDKLPDAKTIKSTVAV